MMNIYDNRPSWPVAGKLESVQHPSSDGDAMERKNKNRMEILSISFLGEITLDFECIIDSPSCYYYYYH
jgi:hypothetical protein